MHCQPMLVSPEISTRFRESAAHLRTSNVQPLPAVGVKRGYSGKREECVRLSNSDKF